MGKRRFVQRRRRDKERPTLTKNDKARIDAFAQRLLTNGFGCKAERLVLIDKDDRDLGGWGFWALRDRIKEFALSMLKAEHRRRSAKR